MSETRTTPGPWIVKNHDGRQNIRIESAEVVRMDNGDPVASVFITVWKQGRRDARPDARLIAAAPDLRDALAAIEALDDGDEPFAWKHAALFDAARAALRKAGVK